MNEYGNWHDTGCEYHPRCLTCPEEECRFDTPNGLQEDTSGRDAAIRRFKAEGIPVATIMEAYEVSRATVYRVSHNGVDKRQPLCYNDNGG